MQQVERVVHIGKNRFELLEDNILFVTINGEVDVETAIKSRDLAYKFIEMTNGQLKSLVDLTKATKQPHESRKIVQKVWDNEQIGRVALFGMSPVARVVASFVIGATNRKNLRFFKTKEEALTWLKE